MYKRQPTTCPLGRRQEMAVRLVAVISRLVLAAVIASAVFAFFVVLGYLAVDAETVKGWTRVDPTAVLQVTTSVRAYVPVSYTHLDVYKRQAVVTRTEARPNNCARGPRRRSTVCTRLAGAIRRS